MAWMQILAEFRRGGSSDKLAQAWGGDDPRLVDWYRESLRSWLGASSERSRETARQVVAFFFAWFAVHYAGSVDRAKLESPSRVQASDVEAWAKYIAGGGSWVVPGFAGDELDVRIVQWLENVGDNARVTSTAIYEGLGKPVREDAFEARLTKLVGARQIERRPKRAEVQVEKADGTKRPLRPGEPYPPSEGRYSGMGAKQKLAPGSVHARLSVLAGLFRAILAPKNLPGESPVRANPASASLLRWKALRASEETQRSTRRKTTRADLELLRALIERSEKRANAVRARDRLFVELCATMGLRVSEVCGARRADLVNLTSGGQSRRGLRVRRKGGKTQELPLSDTVIEALGSLETAIAQSRRMKTTRDALASPNAPLVPALGRWGRSAVAAEQRAIGWRRRLLTRGGTSREIEAAIVPLGRAGADRLLERYARAASQLDPAREREVFEQLRQRLHPHGLRHLFAEVAVDGGVPLRVVSEFLGHESTGQLERRYARRPDLSKFDFGPLLAAATQK